MDQLHIIIAITQAVTGMLFIISELLGLSTCKLNSVCELVVNGIRCTIKKEDIEMQ